MGLLGARPITGSALGHRQGHQNQLTFTQNVLLISVPAAFSVARHRSCDRPCWLTRPLCPFQCSEVFSVLFSVLICCKLEVWMGLNHDQSLRVLVQRDYSDWVLVECH